MTRCIALARRMEEHVRFFVDTDRTWARILANHGFETTMEPNARRGQALLAALTNGEIRASLFDSYDCETDDIAAATEKGFTAAISDDGQRRGENLTIVPTFCPELGGGFLAGPAFAPLDPAFEGTLSTRPVTVMATRILVAFGARDSSNCTGVALEALAQLSRPIEVTVALGGNAPHHDSVRRQIAALPAAQLVIDASNMIALYEESDLAIGAPGVSFLERLCCGVPSMLLCQNSAQRPIAEMATGLGAAELVTDRDPANLATHIEHLMADSARRYELRHRGMALVDGRGAERLAGALVAARSAAKEAAT